jgi:UDP-N-acetylmuramate: L-alanyl-gamma-D-glutamyl-meso-diaminopimelate ligase
MDEADVRYVYFSQHALQLKKLPPLDPDEVRRAFGGNVEVFTDSAAMVAKVKAMEWQRANLLMMSSGNFDGIDFNQLADEVLV